MELMMHSAMVGRKSMRQPKEKCVMRWKTEYIKRMVYQTQDRSPELERSE